MRNPLQLQGAGVNSEGRAVAGGGEVLDSEAGRLMKGDRITI